MNEVVEMCSFGAYSALQCHGLCFRTWAYDSKLLKTGTSATDNSIRGTNYIHFALSFCVCLCMDACAYSVCTGVRRERERERERESSIECVCVCVCVRELH